MTNQKFELGQTAMTRGIADTVANNTEFAKDVASALRRYVNCDFSDMEYPEDIESNSEAIRTGVACRTKCKTLTRKPQKNPLKTKKLLHFIMKCRSFFNTFCPFVYQ